MFFNKFNFNKENGFTLIELLIVISVLTILAVIVIPQVSNIREQSKITSIHHSLHSMNTDLLNKFSFNGFFPVSYNTPVDYTYEQLAEDRGFKLVHNDTGIEAGEKLELEFWSEGNLNYDDLVFSNGIITDYTGSEVNIVIPSEINGEKVVGIGEEVFSDKHIESVDLNNIYLSNIGNSAFHYNNLTELIIPNNITEIGASAFFNNNLEQIEISDNITQIDSSAFYGNNLTEITIPNSITEINSSTFRFNNLTEVIIPDNITIIHTRVFEGNDLTEVVISEGVIEIANASFYDNNLTEVIIPDSVTRIEAKAFSHNEITSIYMPADVDLSISMISTSAWDWSNFDLFGEIDGTADDTAFKDYYDANGQQAGWYTRPNPDSTDWTLQ